MLKYSVLFLFILLFTFPTLAKTPPVQLTFQEKIARGDAYAQYRLGYTYWRATGEEAAQEPKETRENRIMESYAEAAKWFRKSAEQGFPIAQQHLAVSYYLGAGVARDHVEAAKWWRKAAEQGVADAQLRLARLYAEGHLGSEYRKEAGKWYLKAAGQGNREAAETISNLLFEESNYAEAYFWRKIYLRLNETPDAQDALLDRLSMELDEKKIASIEKRLKRWKPQPTRSTLSVKKIENEIICSVMRMPAFAENE